MSTTAPGALDLARRALILDVVPGIGFRTGRRASPGRVRAALTLLLLVRTRIRDVVSFVGQVTVIHALLLGEPSPLAVLARIVAEAACVFARRTLLLLG